VRLRTVERPAGSFCDHIIPGYPKAMNRRQRSVSPPLGKGGSSQWLDGEIKGCASEIFAPTRCRHSGFSEAGE